jgi:hypothetical protein
MSSRVVVDDGAPVFKCFPSIFGSYFWEGNKSLLSVSLLSVSFLTATNIAFSLRSSLSGDLAGDWLPLP